ncbi:hypothetical protein GCM10023084_28150 [Streptomyces lacrimifluminis]|uniref:Secreted protein n=1 Tax=Streptomyces lacrimifluminis TaxID=1500077 RepID=A0A917NTL5_9ACTN|nr:hypothetical protein [Streptomyces lacrimifluminis]GGJ27269.1 hypothetical protein GCM10012282_24770 [Streptomyces lacrimifluminis]
MRTRHAQATTATSTRATRAGLITALSALTALAAAGLALAAPAGATAKPSAPAQPKFLSAAELPPHPSSAWTAGRVKKGVPDELKSCFGGALPGHDSRYREFRTELDTGAVQLTLVAASNAKAKALAERLNKDMRSCAARIEQADPEIEAESRDYGTLAVEEGAHVYGLHTETSYGATDIHLLSVGRDGRAVTVVEWGQLGDFTGAPVKAFKKTTTTAVKKLY